MLDNAEDHAQTIVGTPYYPSPEFFEEPDVLCRRQEVLADGGVALLLFRAPSARLDSELVEDMRRLCGLLLLLLSNSRTSQLSSIDGLHHSDDYQSRDFFGRTIKAVLLMQPEKKMMQHQLPPRVEAGVRVEGGGVLLPSARAGGLCCTPGLLSMVFLVLPGCLLMDNGVSGTHTASSTASWMSGAPMTTWLMS